MKKITLFTLTLIAGWLLFPAFFPADESDNGWRGKNRDGKVENFKVPASWPGQLKQTWRTQVGLGDASPVMVNGKLYLHTKIDSSEVALCINATDGKILWKEINNKAPEVTGGAASHPGPRSTPSISAGKVINVGAGGYVTCRNAETGKLIWNTDRYTGEVPQFFVAVSPLVVGNKVITHMNGKTKGTVVALDINSGNEIWKLEGKSSTYSSPVLMDKFPGLVVVQSETTLLGVSLDKGELLWETPTPGETRFYNSSTPVVNGDHIVVTGQGSGARALKVAQSGGQWSVTESWKNPEYSTSFNTTVLKDGFLYGNEARFGYIFCLNATTGAKCWGDTAKNNRFASMLDLGKVMASLPATGNLIFFEPTEKAYKPIIRYNVADTEVYAHPVFAGDKIFVKDKEFLTGWSL